MGRTVRFDQIFVSSLDADPVEQDVLTSVRSIITSEIEVDDLTASNSIETKILTVPGKITANETDFKVTGLSNVVRMTSSQIGVGAIPVNDFQVGTSNVVINRNATNLMTVRGNLATTNVIASNILQTTNEKFKVDSIGSNVLTLSGDMVATNVNVDTKLTVGTSTNVGSNVAVFQNGNVVVDNGRFILHGDMNVFGNVFISETTTYQTVQNLVVEDPVILMGKNNGAGTFDTALIMSEDTDEANLVFGYDMSENEFVLTRSFIGPEDKTITFDSNTINLHVFGQMYTDGNVGLSNTNPIHTVDVGSNVYLEDTGSNVFHSSGNLFTQRLLVGPGGMQVGSLLTMSPGAEAPVVISSNVQMNAIRTVGTAPSGISNLVPKDTLSIGASIFANIDAENVLTVLGNVATTNLVTDVVSSASSVTVHADRYGGDSTSNVLTLKSGPTASNVSSIEVYGASTSSSNQNIRFKTKNTERVRIESNGKIGIATSSPTETLTVSGNVHVLGSNATVYGNTWNGIEGNTSMRIYSNPVTGENKVENIVKSGKGLNFYTSTSNVMGSAKMTILESSNVGVGTATPQGRFHTSGGTVFINDPIQYDNSYDTAGVPLVVSNTQAIAGATLDIVDIMQLSREGNSDRDGVRAIFKMGKYDNTVGKSKSKLDLFLADDRYTDETEVLTIRADSRVGIGTTQPSAHLEVFCTGVANPTENGLIVHNHEAPSGDAIVAMQTNLVEGNAFTSYIQSDNDTALTGWSVGASGSSDFRITENYEKVSDAVSTALYISGTARNVGLGTDAPREKLEVNGNVVVGEKITFGGLENDIFGNCYLQERVYDPSFKKTELLIFKGNDGGGDAQEGPDRIYYLAPQHLFKTYTSSNVVVDPDDSVNTNLAMTIAPSGVVVVGGSDATVSSAATKLKVNGDIEFASGGSFIITGLAFLTTSDSPSVNIIRSISDGSTKRPITFTHKVGSDPEVEFARFDGAGRLGIGTESPASNIHLYDPITTDLDMLKLESPGTNKKTGILLYTTDNYGGYVRGFRNSTHTTSGITIGATDNSVEADGLHIVHTSNVGIGTVNPMTQFHVYDGVARVEDSSSNAIVEFKTTGGVSNIYGDTLGNVYIEPSSTETKIQSNLTVRNNLTVQGEIDLGDQVAIGLGGASANTELHVNGGVITNSDGVADKKYSNAFTLTTSQAKDITLTFNNSAFYAKLVMMLRETSTVSNISTLILELHGGTSDGTQSGENIAIGTKNLFGGTNAYPWSPTVTTTANTISVVPADGAASTQEFAYDIHVELLSSIGGGLTTIRFNSDSETLKTYTY
tara:strand:+ start:221 stop:4150 length:3930 start_codon:yes stop_codon:yes gene_type:complete